MTELYLGLMSGTSVDGIDAAVVNFDQPKPQIIATYYEPMPESLRLGILELCQPGFNEVNRMGEIDVALGKQFAKTANTLLEKHHIDRKTIRAIGSHGQTIRHHPEKKFTIQIGDPNIIAAETNITTIADFRRRDVALGGQGAPLVPAFHQYVFADKNTDRVIVNIGGIANITLLPVKTKQIITGFDTGPGNTLLDAWVSQHLHKPYDASGNWASQGTADINLLETLLNDPFFQMKPPKSTGREYFNLAWLQSHLSTDTISPVDVQATLLELTAHSIMNAINSNLPDSEILICGGGVHNDLLMERLRKLTKNHTLNSTSSFGVDPDWVEAMAFAWLAQQTLHQKPGNITSVTGAKQAAILGGLYYA